MYARVTRLVRPALHDQIGCQAQLISHSHQAHNGLAHRLSEETMFLIGRAAEGVLSDRSWSIPGRSATIDPVPSTLAFRAPAPWRLACRPRLRIPATPWSM